ncbi:MAG: alanine racemase [Actinobacteria bacterium]|nr:alanine racemase [Actinomycetota bacterium]
MTEAEVSAKSEAAITLPIPRSFPELDTPLALIEHPTLLRNIGRVAQAARTRGLAVRPHAKAHKSVDLARLQLEHGATGITVAKLSEAEALAAGGIDDLFVCYPLVERTRVERLIALSRRARISTIVESEPQARLLAEAATAAGVELDVTIDVDTGLGRVGVALGPPLEALVHLVERLDGLRLRGLSTHEGFVYGIADPALRRARLTESLSAFVLAGQALSLETISAGATPTIFESMEVSGLTEVRPGNYVFYDAIQVALGAASLEDCAFSVLATVVSVRSGSSAIIDAGSKALSADAGVHGLALLSGYGIVLGRPDVSVIGLSEEHGWLSLDPQGDGVQVGDQLRIIPNHACATVANFDRAYLWEGESVIQEIPISARGAFS